MAKRSGSVQFGGVEESRYGVEDESALFADARTLQMRRQGHFRSWNCSKKGVLSQANVDAITSVTFLSATEVKNIELVFQFIVEQIREGGDDGTSNGKSSHGVGQLNYVTRRINRYNGEGECVGDECRNVIALTTSQLRRFLPELHHNVFLDRLVRIFSESGEQLLTLIELTDLYSTFSPRAPIEWKTRAAFNMFDFNEHNRLDERDLVRIIGRLVHGTRRSANHMMSREDAAVSIQRLYRGFQERCKATDKTDKAGKADGKAKKAEKADKSTVVAGSMDRPKDLRTHMEQGVKQSVDRDKNKKTILESFASKMVEGCDSIVDSAMDFPYFLEVMSSFEYFDDNFCLSAIRVEDLRASVQLHEKTLQDEADGQEGGGRLACCQSKETRSQEEDVDKEELMSRPADFVTSPSSPRLVSDASPGQQGRSKLRKLAEQIWKDHTARRRLSRLDGSMDGMNLDGSLSYDEAVQMLVQNVLSQDGKVHKELLPKHSNDQVLPSETISDWITDEDKRDYRVGDGRVSLDSWVQYIERLVDRDGYSEAKLLRHMEWVLALHMIWPDWTKEQDQKKRKAPRWTQDKTKSYHKEPTLAYNAGKQVLEKLWMIEWRYWRAQDFCEFHAEVMDALRVLVDGQKTASEMGGKRKAANGATIFFQEYDQPPCGGLSKKQLACALSKLLNDCLHKGCTPQQISNQVDMLMHLIVDLDPHGPGYVHKSDFCNFFDLKDSDVKVLAEAVVATDLSSTRYIDVNADEDIDDGEHATHKSYLAEVERLRGDVRSTYVWSWPIFDRLFDLWWREYPEKDVGSGRDCAARAVSLGNFMEAWVSDTVSIRMVRYASTVNEEQDLRMCHALWDKMDENNSGSILLSDAKALIGNHIVCEHGHHFMALNARGRDAKKHQAIVELFSRAVLELRLAGLDIQMGDHLKVLDTSISRLQAHLRTRGTDGLKVAQEGSTLVSDAAPRLADSETERLNHELKHLQKQRAERKAMRRDVRDQLNRQGVYDPAERKKRYPDVKEIDMPKIALLTRIESAEWEQNEKKRNTKMHNGKKSKTRTQADTQQVDTEKLLQDANDYERVAVRVRDAGLFFSELQLEVAGLNIKSKHHKALVSKASFVNWWRKQRWIVKEYTYKYHQLEKIWPQLVGTTGEEGLRLWKVRAILTVVWDLEDKIEASIHAREDFNRRLMAWLHEYDRDSSGTISCDQFGIWFVAQPYGLVERAAKYPWDELEVRFDRDSMMAEFGAMLAEVQRDVENLEGVDTEDELKERAKMDERERALESMLGDLDNEIQGQSILVDIEDDRIRSRSSPNLTKEHWESERSMQPVKRHQTAFGVKNGGSRQPLLRNRLKLMQTLTAEQVVALERAESTGSFCWRFWHGMTRDDVKEDRDLLNKTAVAVTNGDPAYRETVGDVLDNYFHVHKVRCCCDTYWTHDLNLWFKTNVVNSMQKVTDKHLHKLERSFGYGVAEILRRAKFMIWLNFGLSIIWLGGVIVPRDYTDGHGLWNTTKAVLGGIFYDSTGSETSLFYDGYTKQPVYWPPGLSPSIGWRGFLARLDLLYFVCILLHVAVSLFVVLNRMGGNLHNIHRVAIGANLHEYGTHGSSESRKCATVLGMYPMSVPNESDEMERRQHIRRTLDKWSQSLFEHEQEEAMIWTDHSEHKATWRTRCKFLTYETKLLAGLSATLAVLVMYVVAISWMLINESSFDYAIGSSLAISMLNGLVPFVLKKIVKHEKHIRQTAELKAVMYRIYAFKLIQLAVIMYSLGKISIAEEGSLYQNTKSQASCPEREFGTTFLRLTCTDAIVFLATQYGYLFAVNYGLPMPNWKLVEWRFQTRADRARYKVLLGWNRCCWKVRAEEIKLVPGRVAGTKWEIRAKTYDDSNLDKHSVVYVDIWSGAKKKAMPPAVRKALGATYRLQERTLKPPKLALPQILRGERQQDEQKQWWLRHYVADDHVSDIVHVTFDPALGYVGPLPIEFDFSAMYRKGCCQRKVTIAPTIKRIDFSRQVSEGLMELLMPGMKLLKVTCDTHGYALSELSVRELLELLNSHHKITLEFEAVEMVQNMEDWATSQAMRHLTAGSLTIAELDMMAQLMVDAGYATKEDFTKANSLPPRHLAKVIANQRGKHKCKHMLAASGPHRKVDESLQTTLLEPGRQYTTVMHMVSIEPLCKMCTKTVACCNLKGGRVPEWCKQCATHKMEGITSAVEVSAELFLKFETAHGVEHDGVDTAELDDTEIRPLLIELKIDPDDTNEFRGIKAEGLSYNDSETCKLHDFSAWFDRRQRRKALEARAQECGVPEDQIQSDTWRESDDLEVKRELDAKLIDAIVESSYCDHPHVLLEDGAERPVACDQACYVILNADTDSPELSYVLPKVDPKTAFDSCDLDDNQSINSQNLKSIFKVMGVKLPGIDKRFRTAAMDEMAGSETGTVLFPSFDEWWKTTGAREVLPSQSRATGRVHLSRCNGVTIQPGRGGRRHIRLETADHILILGVQEAEEALRAGAADAAHPPWSTMLSAAVPDQRLVANWGPDTQASTERLVAQHNFSSTRDKSSRLGHMANAQRRARDLRTAEQHVHNAYGYASGSTAAKTIMIRELFDRFDHDSSGSLDFTEVGWLLKQLRTPSAVGQKDVKVRLKKAEVRAIIKEIEDADKSTKRNKLIEFAEFNAWWEKRVKDRREASLPEEHWAELRTHASVEFAAAINIYSDIESRLKNSLMKLFEKTTDSTREEQLVSAVHLGAATQEADLPKLFHKYAKDRGLLEESAAVDLLQHLRVRSNDPKDTHAIFSKEKRIRMWERMDKCNGNHVDLSGLRTWWEARAQHRGNHGRPPEYWTVEDAKRAHELEDERVALNVMEICDLRDTVAEAGLGEEAQHLIDEVVLVREKRDILSWCKKAEEEMSSKTRDPVPKSKPMSHTRALRYYEEALRLDPTNPRVKKRVKVLTMELNHATKQLSKDKILAFATQLIKFSGDWSEVTAEVNEQRLFKPHQKKLDAKYCAQLLIDIISRQSYVWVGSTWCPWLPLVAFILQILIFWALSHAMCGVNFLGMPRRALVRSNVEWSAEETKRLFTTLALGALLACVIPQLMWLNREPTCGPHSAEDYEDEDGNILEGTHAAVFETFSVYLQWLQDRGRENGESTLLGDEVSVVASFFFNPPVLLIIICLLWMRYRYYRANCQLLIAELQKQNALSKTEKRNFAYEHKKSAQRIVDTGDKYGNKMRELAGSAKTAASVAKKHKKARILEQHFQHEHDSAGLASVYGTTDKIMYNWLAKSKALQGCSFEHKSIAAAQSQLDLATSLRGDEDMGNTPHELLRQFSLFIGNIDVHFATEAEVEREVCRWSSDRAVLACTVKRISDSEGSAEASPQKYVFPSWALVTFVSEKHMAQLHSKMSASPPLDPSHQQVQGSWHTIRWPEAKSKFSALEDFQGDIGVSENSSVGASAFVQEHNERLRRALKDTAAIFIGEHGSKATKNAGRDDASAKNTTRTASTTFNPMLTVDVDAPDEEADDNSNSHGRMLNPMLAVQPRHSEHDATKKGLTHSGTSTHGHKAKTNAKKKQKKKGPAFVNPMHEHNGGD